MRIGKLHKITVALGASGALACGALGLVSSVSSCSSSPTPVSVRTFERAGRMDVVCLDVSSDPATPVEQANCAPVADGTDTSLLRYHLFALVTQTLRGEVAVVDLTASSVVDVSRTQPGINFLPVGNNPTDIVATPNGRMVFVASAEVNKPAIYGIPSARVIGDSRAGTSFATELTEWPVCALPQAPGRMAILPAAPTQDGGVGDGGDAGGSLSAGSRLAVLLPGDAQTSAKIVTIDMDAFTTNAIAPGSLAPCPITSAIELSSDLPASWSAGPSWPDGIPYADGGVDLFKPTPGTGAPQLPLWTIGASLPAIPDAGAIDGGDAGSTDASADGAIPDSGATDSGATDAGADAAPSFALKKVPGTQAHGRGMAFDGTTLYVADDALPLVHVIDTSGGTLSEKAPYVATSLATPSRIVTTSEVSVSPVTHDYKRYLYALDDREGTIIVYDATDPATASRSPMTRPHAELVPAQPPDRIRFALPITAFAFVRHDVPLKSYLGANGNTVSLAARKTGLQCNPNRGLEHGDSNRSQGPFSLDKEGTQFNDVALGANYRANVSQDLGLGPGRLRGIFAFVTLSNGQVVVVDVDDWDAACRRPTDLVDGFQSTSLAISQTNDTTTFDPFHWGQTDLLTPGIKVDSSERFFPISQPNRPRSVYLLKNDPTTGNHVPYVLGSLAQLSDNGVPVEPGPRGLPTLVRPTEKFNATMTDEDRADKTVRISYEDPTPHVDQDWTMTYEGVLPGFDGVVGTLGTTDAFASVTLTNPSGLFCRRGIEDQRLGQERIRAMRAEPLATPDSIPIRIDERIADYVMLTDELLASNDPYWGLNGADGQPLGCWDVPLDGSRNLKSESAGTRYQVCSDKFGAASQTSAQREFPIVEAYDDHLVLGRYLYTDTKLRPTNGRVIAPRDTSSQVDFKLAQCCFHSQAHFKVRTGAQWLTLGSVAGYLHHVSADTTTRACVHSTAPREVLLNSRLVEFIVPPDLPPTDVKASATRNSALAMRNPVFAAALRGVNPAPNSGRFTNSTRDLQWKFAMRGQFVPQIINLASGTTAVVPQSMSFIDSIGRLAVVDGSSQGLILISLDSVAVAGSPYF